MKLKIIHISDTHGKHKKIEVPECDILIHSGDVSPIGEKHQIESFLKWFTGLTQATYRIWIPGNHDRGLDLKLSGVDVYEPIWDMVVDEYLNRDDNLVYLNNNSCDVMGVKVWGSPVTPEFGYGWAFNKPRGEEIEKVWEHIPLDTDIVVTHGPAYGFVDWANNLGGAGSVGCEELRKHVKRVKPLLHLSGHVHEAYGYAYDADTNYFNGSICNLSYEPINAPWVIEADFEERTISISNDTSKGQEAKSDQDGSSGGERTGEL